MLYCFEVLTCAPFFDDTNCVCFSEFVTRGVISDDGHIRDIKDMLEACYNKFSDPSLMDKLLKNVVEIASFKKQVKLVSLCRQSLLQYDILNFYIDQQIKNLDA